MNGASTVTPPDNDPFRWFAEEVQVHEGVLRAWLRSRFPSVPDVDDLVQESFHRVWLAREAGPILAPKAFLFATARHLALDQIRRDRVATFEPIAEMDESSVLQEETSVPDAVAKTQELQLLTRAIQQLPDRCRQVLTLRKIYGLSQREIAAKLGIAEHTVEVQVGLGMRRCAEFLAKLGLP